MRRPHERSLIYADLDAAIARGVGGEIEPEILIELYRPLFPDAGSAGWSLDARRGMIEVAASLIRAVEQMDQIERDNEVGETGERPPG